MADMTAPVSACPVPPDQMPLNEYRSLQDSWFYGWSSWSLAHFIGRLLWIGGPACLISAPIATYSFPPDESFVHFLLSTLGGAIFWVGLVLLRLYLGWLYVHQRLTNKTIPYEETGWYDGQFWTKGDAEMMQDLLVDEYQVKPILQRLKYVFSILGLLCMTGIFVWRLS
jgi:hypothetical protein